MDDFLTTIFSGARHVDLPSGGFLFHAGDPVHFMHLVEEGTLSLERLQPGGQITCFQRAGPGEVLAEASLYAQVYHCDAHALADTRLRKLPTGDFGRRMASDPRLAHAWATHLARSVQRARLIAEIRSLKTVGNRLDAWLGAFQELPAKGHWHALADELAVSPEALYRELAKRRASRTQS